MCIRDRDEALKAKERVAKFNLDGFVINAEVNAKNKPAETRAYVNGLAGIGVPVGLSTYRYPTLHRELDYKTFLEVCDFGMPQVYWVSAINAGSQLSRSLDEWRALTDLPIIPTGAAYSERGWTAQPSEVIDFMQTAISLKLDAVNFWVWKHAVNLGLWDYIAQFPWPSAETPIPPISPLPQMPDDIGVKIDVPDKDTGVSVKYHGRINKVV